MKKFLLILLLLGCAFFAQAQTGKPTKQQTFEFIKDFFENTVRKQTLKCYTVKSEKFNEFREFGVRKLNLQLTEDSCKIIFYIENYENYSTFGNIDHLIDENVQYFKEKYVIDFSKVEQQYLFIHTEIGKTNNLNEASIIFKAVPPYAIEAYVDSDFKSFDDAKLPDTPSSRNEVRLPVEYFCGGNYDPSKTFEKVIKAFNHLRKLCGAPEPISFD